MREWERYTKQIALETVGWDGQKRLREGKVLVVGVGGLGCPALIQLVSAGVGEVRFVDGDEVAISNLPRQALFCEEDVGRKKAVVARERLLQLNPRVKLEGRAEDLTERNSESCLHGVTIVVDATDSPTARVLLSRECAKRGIAHVYGAVKQMEGQVGVFNVLQDNGEVSAYTDLFAQPFPPLCTCEEGGILGMVPSVVGTLQALEVVKLLLGEISPLQSHLLRLRLDGFETQLFRLPFGARQGKGYSLPLSLKAVKKVSQKELAVWEASSSPPLLIDVRDAEEREEDNRGGVEMPLEQLMVQPPSVQGKRVVLFCKSGKRSALGALYLSEKFPDCDVYVLESLRPELLPQPHVESFDSMLSQFADV